MTRQTRPPKTSPWPAGDPGPIGTESQMHEPRRSRICLCYTTMGPPRRPWEHSTSCAEFRRKPLRRMLVHIALWVGIVGAIAAVVVAIAMVPVAPRSRNEIAWQRVDEYTDRGCDAKGNLLYRHWRGGFAGTELIVLEGGCR